MIKKSVVVLKFMWFILFSAFVFLQNHILFLEKMNNTGLYIYPTREIILSVVFSFCGALILNGNTLTKILSKKYSKKFDWSNLILCLVCLVLSLSRIAAFTLFAKLPNNMLLQEISSPISIEFIFGFSSGYFFTRIINLKNKGEST